jgi:hypothetical protein
MPSKKPAQNDPVSLAGTNLANLRNLLSYFSQDGLKRNAHAQEGAKAATAAIESLEAGNAQEALSCALQATSAMSRLKHEHDKLNYGMLDTLEKTVRVLQPYLANDFIRRLGKRSAKAERKQFAESRWNEYYAPLVASRDKKARTAYKEIGEEVQEHFKLKKPISGETVRKEYL